MSLLAITLGSGLILLIAYFTYGRWVSRQLGLRDDVPTPACEINDGVDFVPTPAPYLFSQHFSAIAAAGPIVGPILAGLAFGWLPSILWILVGCIFIGAVHDITSLIASVRHKARSIADVVREHMSRRAYLLFLSFVWIALVYIIVAFTDVTASTFAPPATASAEAIETGKAVASSSMMYLGLAVVMGVVLRFTKISLAWATAIFMPLVLVTIWAGPHLPLGLPGWIDNSPTKTWDVLLLVYCFVASVVPVWALLQPRGYLGGYFLTVTVALAFLGIVAAGLFGQAISIQYPAFKGFLPEDRGFMPLFPILFVTIACGACSGFHSIISSGTSSKQLKTERDARPIGFGCMLLEGFVAVISLCTVMILAPGPAEKPDRVFANGVSQFIAMLAPALGMGVEQARAYLFNFALLAFATFIYDTLDVCTRLGRYVLQEFTGWHTTTARYVCTLLTLIPPMYLVLQTMTDPATGKPVPAWSVFWLLFGTANQLLAALTLLGVTVWLLRTGRNWWYTAIPAVFMMVVTLTSLGIILVRWASGLFSSPKFDPNGPISTLLFALAVLLVIEAVVVIRRNLQNPVAAIGSA
jgi:carbon starvation protein